MRFSVAVRLMGRSGEALCAVRRFHNWRCPWDRLGEAPPCSLKASERPAEPGRLLEKVKLPE